MLKNYLRAAWRNAIRDRLHASINVVGLGIGFAAALLIALFVRDELGYDQFLAGHDRIFRIGGDLTIQGRPVVHSALVLGHVAPALALDFPEFEGVARVYGDRVGLRHGDVEVLERIYWADPKFLSVIGLPVIAGDAATALDAPDSVVLTRSMARKYFGTDMPIGSTLELGRQHPLRVTAVLEDLPPNTHLDTQILVSGLAPFSDLTREDADKPDPNNNNFGGWAYARLKPGVDRRAVESRLPAFIHQYFPWVDGSTPNSVSIALRLDPLTDIHLSPAVPSMTEGGSPSTIAAVSIVALVILAIASINFINLMTARAARRSVEVGVRKALGATYGQLVFQFMSESTAFALIAAVIAIAVVELVLPSFNAFLGRQIGFAYWQDPELAAGIAGLVLLVGIGAGLYPALVMAAFRPASVLKGGRAGAGSGRLRQALVVLQFAASIGLAVATLVIVRQTDFATGNSLRFDKDQVLLVEASEACSDTFRDRVAALPGVKGVACSRSAPLNFSTIDGTSTLPDGREVDVDKTPIDFGFFELYGLKPLAGRLFDRARQNDELHKDDKDPTPSVVINETAVRAYGFATPAAAIGQQVAVVDKAQSVIVGVVPDFPIGSIRDAVSPTVFYVNRSSWGLLSVKLDGRNVAADLSGIDKIWSESVNDRPIKRFFLDSRIEELYEDITRQSEVFAIFAAVALLIGCLGLFGLSAFTAERRTKEIGIRKALGASTADVSLLLIWQFVKPVLIANAIAWPLTYLIMRRWLDGFAYRITLSVEPFLIAGAAALAIAILTTAFHAFQVARSRPVLALRYE